MDMLIVFRTYPVEMRATRHLQALDCDKYVVAGRIRENREPRFEDKPQSPKCQLSEFGLDRAHFIIAYL